MPEDISIEEIDALEVGGPGNQERPMSATVDEAPEPQEFELEVNGKQIKAPWDKVRQWAQLGYSHPQKMNEFKTKETEFQTERQKWTEIQEKMKPYQEVDKYAQENKEWWDHVQSQYKSKIEGAQSNPEMQQIKNELAEIRQFKEEIAKEKETVKMKEEDTKLTGEVESIRKMYPNTDFDTPDDEGNSLEMKVLKHAMENGIESFRVAFRDYYHDHLLGKAKEEGKELVSKEVQKRTKLGILGETSKPTKGLKVAENTKGRSYDQLKREALEEMGLA